MLRGIIKGSYKRATRKEVIRFGMTGVVGDAVRHAVGCTVGHGSFTLVASTTCDGGTVRG